MIETLEEQKIDKIFDTEAIKYIKSNENKGIYYMYYLNNITIYKYSSHWTVVSRIPNVLFQFNIYNSPTANCQLVSISSFNVLLNGITNAFRYDKNGSKYLNSEEKRELFKRILQEIYFFSTNGGDKEIKQILIDINCSYKMYLTGSELHLNLPDSIFVTKNDYVSTNGSHMFLAIINLYKMIYSL